MTHSSELSGEDTFRTPTRLSAELQPLAKFICSVGSGALHTTLMRKRKQKENDRRSFGAFRTFSKPEVGKMKPAGHVWSGEYLTHTAFTVHLPQSGLVRRRFRPIRSRPLKKVGPKIN